MTDAAANVAGSVGVQITGNLTPFEAALAKAEAMAQAFDARMKALLGGSVAGAALNSINASVAETSAAMNTITAPATAAAAAIDAIAAPATAAAAEIDAIGTSALASAGATDIMSASVNAAGISRKALAEALALTNNDLVKATALMAANAAAADAMAASAATATEAVGALGAAQTRSRVGAATGAGLSTEASAASIAATTAAAKGLNTELANVSTLSGRASAELIRIPFDIARGNIGRLTSSTVVLATSFGEAGASLLSFKSVVASVAVLADLFLNPVFIALIALPEAARLAFQGFDALAGSGKSLTEVLKENDQWIKSIASSFPSAAAAAKSYADAASKIPTVVAQDQAQSQISALREQLNSQLRDIGNFQSVLQMGVGKNPAFLAGGGSDVLAAINGLGSGGTLTNLQAKLGALHLSRTLAPDIKGMVGDLQESVKTAIDLQNHINGNSAAADHLTEAYQQLALAAAERKVELAANDNITKSLQFQISTLGQSNAAVAAAKEYQDVWNHGIEVGRTDLQELAAQAASAAGQVANLTSAMVAANAHSNLQFSLSLIGLSTAQQKAAQALRAPGQTSAADVLKGPGANDTVLNDTYSEFIALTAKADPASKKAAADLAFLKTNAGLTADQYKILSDRMVAFNALATHGGGGGLNAFNSTLASITKQTDALKAQIATFGQSTAATDAAKVSQQLLDAALQDHIRLSPSLRKSIQDMADQYGAAQQKLDDLKAASKASAAAFAALKQTAEDASSTFASTFISDLRNGTSVVQSFADAMSQALDQIANKLINMAIDNLWSNAFGGMTSGGGGSGGIVGMIAGLFGAGGGASAGLGMGANGVIGGFANGTMSAPGGLAFVGEQGKELVSLPAGAGVIPAPQTARLLSMAANGSANSNLPPINISVDARGAQQGVGAEIAQALSNFSRNELPTRMAQINRNPSRRG